MPGGDRGLAAHGGKDRKARGSGERREFLPGAGAAHSVAHEERRTLRAAERFNQWSEVGIESFRARLNERAQGGRWHSGRRQGEDILRDVEVGRAGRAGYGELNRRASELRRL